MDLLNETVLLKTKSTLFNLLIRGTSQFLCYERLLNMTYVAYKNAFFREMQFWSHCYTVASYQALSRLSVYKIPAVYLSGAKNVCFCTISDFGSPTTMSSPMSLRLRWAKKNWYLSCTVVCGWERVNQGVAHLVLTRCGIAMSEIFRAILEDSRCFQVRISAPQIASNSSLS